MQKRLHKSYVAAILLTLLMNLYIVVGFVSRDYPTWLFIITCIFATMLLAFLGYGVIRLGKNKAITISEIIKFLSFSFAITPLITFHSLSIMLSDNMRQVPSYYQVELNQLFLRLLICSLIIFSSYLIMGIVSIFLFKKQKRTLLYTLLVVFILVTTIAIEPLLIFLQIPSQIIHRFVVFSFVIYFGLFPYFAVLLTNRSTNEIFSQYMAKQLEKSVDKGE